MEEGPAPKIIKLQESVTKEIITTTENVSTQTTSAAIPATPRKKKLRQEVKVLKQRLKRRNTTVNNLKCLLKIIKKRVITILKSNRWSNIISKTFTRVLIRQNPTHLINIQMK